MLVPINEIKLDKEIKITNEYAYFEESNVFYLPKDIIQSYISDINNGKILKPIILDSEYVLRDGHINYKAHELAGSIFVDINFNENEKNNNKGSNN